jgi:hypothetical protein
MSGHLSIGMPDTDVSGMSKSEATMRKKCIHVELNRCLDLMAIERKTFNALNIDGNTLQVF